MAKLTTQQAAQKLGVSIGGLKHLVATGQLPYHKRWLTGSLYFIEHDVVKLRIALDRLAKSTHVWMDTVTDRQLKKQRIVDPYDLDFTYLGKCKATPR